MAFFFGVCPAACLDQNQGQTRDQQKQLKLTLKCALLPVVYLNEI